MIDFSIIPWYLYLIPTSAFFIVMVKVFFVTVKIKPAISEEDE